MKQGWEIKKLGECFEYIKNGANIKQERGAGGIPITRIETLSGGVFNRDRLGYADIETIDKYQSYVMESGDLLLSHINSKSYIGRVVVYVKEGDETIIHGMNLLRLKVASNLISPFYMYYYSQTHKFKSQIANRRKDAVNQSSISVTDLKTIDIPVPPIEEQERIVEELNCLSGVIEKKREQLKELDALAESIFYTMFGDPITNEKGWEVKKWKDMLTIVNGKNQKAVENPDGAYPIYGSGGIMGYADKFLCPNDTIVLGRKGNINKPIFVREQFWNVDTAFGLVSNKVDLDACYLFFYCKIFDFEQLNKAVTIPSLTKSDLLELITPCPPLALQQEFADKIEAIEKQKELIKQSITETEELFNSRMDYYFN